MGSLSRIVISLPLILVPLMAATPHASAAGMRPSDAVRLLAQSRTVDGRCHHLDGADHQQLADYVARAEVASAQIDGVATTKQALASGNAAGKTMACDASSKAMVTATLAAARQAEKLLGPELAKREKKVAASRRSQSQKRPQRATASNAQVTALQQPVTREPDRLFGLSGSGGALDLYTRHAAAYYIERRCGFLSSRNTMAFWRLIVERHNAMIAHFGGAAVARAKARAEDQGAAACSSQAQVFVRAAWNDIQRYR